MHIRCNKSVKKQSQQETRVQVGDRTFKILRTDKLSQDQIKRRFVLMYLGIVGTGIGIILHLIYFGNKIEDVILRNIVLFSLISALSGCVGHLQTLAKGTRFSCDEKALDLWSFGHFFWHTLLALIFYALVSNIYFAIISSILFSIVWEIIESRLTKVYYNYACESKGNRIIDFVLGIFGSIMAIMLI